MKKHFLSCLKETLGSIHGQQGGQILILATILLLLSSIMIIPLTHLINTGIKTTQAYQRNAKEIYAADSGIQYAIWKIKNDPSVIADRNSNSFDQAYSYTAPTINNNTVGISMTFTWLLAGIVSQLNGADPHQEWVGMDVSGNANPSIYGVSPNTHSIYTITYAFSGSGNKKIDMMGVWLPHGFNYVNSSCSHANFPNNIAPEDPVISPVYGGSSLIWNAHNFSFKNVNPPIAQQQFWYTPAGSTPKGAASWVKSQSSDIGYSWDNAIAWYIVTSTAVDHSVSPAKNTVINAVIVSDPSTSSGINVVTYIINP
jgi:hypothetical protein